jgi:hypothetical protein
MFELCLFFHFINTMSLKITLKSCVSYYMANYSHRSCVNQHKQIHVCNILFNLTIMLDFLIITDIATLI